LHFGYLIPFFDGYKWLNQVYWTLAIEFQYYFFIAFSFIPLVKSNLQIRIIFYFGFLVSSFIGSSEFLPYWLPVFLLGIILFLYRVQLIFLKEFGIVLSLLLVLCLYKYPLASVIYMLIPVIAIIFFSNFKIAVLHALGKMSYSIYLCHTMIGSSVINLLSHSITSDFGKVGVIILGLISTMISSYFMFRFAEKPSKHYSSQIKY